MSFSVDGQARASWQAEPPEPYANAEYYEGVIWRRIFAYAVDLFILGIVVVFAWIALGALTVLSLGLLSPLWLLCGFIPLAYHTLLLAGPHSATLGMRLFGIELRSWTGERPLFLQALIQTVLFYLSIAATCSLILLVALFNRKHRTVHDFIAGTMVVRRFPPIAILQP